jgi:hypothetical protein
LRPTDFGGFRVIKKLSDQNYIKVYKTLSKRVNFMQVCKNVTEITKLIIFDYIIVACIYDFVNINRKCGKKNNTPLIIWWEST